MDANRLHLNFGSNNERLAPSDRTYPTTPSTFPQPVFPNPSQQHSSAQLQPAQQYSGSYAPPNNYFAQGQYQSQYAPHQAVDYAAQTAYQPRSNTPGNDPNVGLAHQFSHQTWAALRGPMPTAPVVLHPVNPVPERLALPASSLAIAILPHPCPRDSPSSNRPLSGHLRNMA